LPLGWLLDAFDFTIFLFIMAAIANEFGVSVTAVAAVLALTIWMRLVGAVASGWLADRIGRKTPLMSILWYLVCNFIVGFSPNLTFLLVFRAALGIGMGAEWPASCFCSRCRLRFSIQTSGSFTESWPARSNGRRLAGGLSSRLRAREPRLWAAVRRGRLAWTSLARHPAGDPLRVRPLLCDRSRDDHRSAPPDAVGEQPQLHITEESRKGRQQNRRRNDSSGSSATMSRKARR
jgi:hypothetical protein